ncbi:MULTISPECIES: hypothetical protein [unclassified Cupriavidus]|uniref:hypothetical protein n=1 Tax=unclassified Cupriavidus TaxID=2640874 RepID=UPI0013667474|nr:hypothetical protein [Cupriavidus sp. SW-Y-13]MWL92014.1 hypothetical protein [Cupriavidus sp. SW-Y-13]
MRIATNFVLLVIALAMFAYAWNILTQKRPAVQGAPCIAQQGVKATADGTPVVCHQDMGWKPAQ